MCVCACVCVENEVNVQAKAQQHDLTEVLCGSSGSFYVWSWVVTTLNRAVWEKGMDVSKVLLPTTHLLVDSEFQPYF